MEEKPILFSGEMVRAILDGRKTQTRRVLDYPDVKVWWLDGEGFWCGSNTRRSSADAYHLEGTEPSPDIRIKCPYGRPGDQLWVRENWAIHGLLYDDLKPSRIHHDDGGCWEEGDSIWYEADGENPAPATGGCTPSQRGKWRPSIHMPRWASRINLTVDNVRVERLQDISHQDALSEGVSMEPYEGLLNGEPATIHPICPVDTFARLWNSINDSRGFGWSANSWVWAVSFELELE